MKITIENHVCGGMDISQRQMRPTDEENTPFGKVWMKTLWKYGLSENENDHFFISIMVFLVEKNELLNLCLCNSKAACRLTGIKSVGRSVGLAKFCFDVCRWNTDFKIYYIKVEEKHPSVFQTGMFDGFPSGEPSPLSSRRSKLSCGKIREARQHAAPQCPTDWVPEHTPPRDCRSQPR